MGNRREPRVEQSLKVRLFGTNSEGRIFSENVTTVNLSQRGIQICGVKAPLKLDEIVGISHKQDKGHFRIQWIGDPGTPLAGHLGLVNLNPEKPFWDFALPGRAVDAFQPKFLERRKHARIRCTASVELHPEGASMIWGKASDLSTGGCYIEMAIPLPRATKIKVGIWVGEKKCWAGGKITNSTPGFGFGIQFTEVAEKDAKLLADFLKDAEKN